MSLFDALERRFVGGYRRIEGLDDLSAEVRRHRFSYLLFLPTLLFIVVLLWLPFLTGVWMSFHEWSLQSEPTWVGLDHYAYLFTWDAFYTSLEATLFFGLTTFVQLGIAIVAALVLKEMRRFRALVSGIYLLPYTMPPVVIGTIWLFLLNPNFGPFFQFPIEMGLIEQPIYWSSDGTSALAVVTGVLAWTFWPFVFLIVFATLESIPDQYYEAAQVYGANRLQTFRHITLPQLKSAILVAISIRMVWNLSKISQPFQLTGGGPGYDTSVLGVLLYRFAYQQGRFGLGFAVGIVLLAIALVFVLAFFREFEKERAVRRT